MYEILNHKVVRVEYLDECEDVYDIEVADNHNFALAAGVFVHNSKDQADAVCGATYLASQFAEEYSYNYEENLDAALDANLDPNDGQRKTKMLQEFQEELLKLYAETEIEPPFSPRTFGPSEHSMIDATDSDTTRETTLLDYATLMEIADGIIVL